MHSGAEELREFMPQVPEERFRRMQIPTYTRQNFIDDLRRVTQGRIDPVLAVCLVEQSNAAVHWMKDIGVAWEPEKVTEVDGKLYLPGGHHIHPIGGGPGMLAQLRDIAFNRNGVEIRYDSRVRAIHGNDRRVEGVVGEVGPIDLLDERLHALDNLRLHRCVRLARRGRRHHPTESPVCSRWNK